MQAKNHDGTYGEPTPFSQDGMNKLLQKKDVSHVEVFEGTPEELAKRAAFKNNLKVKKKYQKVPRNDKRF
jgi:hypothetical protein